jgi:DNA-binding NtrC family response regulator
MRMPHVLIVDDDVSQSAALAAILRHNGHEAEHATSAGQALSCLRHREPDLVLLDITMPQVDGLHLLDALADEPRFDGLRIAIYSGRTDPDAFAAAKRLGACDFIVKGDDLGQTLSRIESHLAAATADAGEQ